jgi:hypothetical protein
MRTVQSRQQARWAPVRNYTVVQRYLATEVPLHYAKMTVDGATTFRMVPQAEWEPARIGMSSAQVLAKAEGMATGLDMLGDAHMKEIGGAQGEYIKSMTSEMAFFLREAKKFDSTETGADAAAAVRMAAAFARRARLVAREQVDGRTAFLIRANDLSDVKLPAANEGPEFRLRTVTLWIDSGEYVPLRLRMEGNLATGGGPIVIELQEREYKQFGSLYEPTRRTMRISGLMEAGATDPKQQKELAKAREAAEKSKAQLAKMDEQLARLTPEQRKMVQGQIDKAKRQMEMMADKDVIEVELTLDVIGINEGPPLNWRPSGSVGP